MGLVSCTLDGVTVNFLFTTTKPMTDRGDSSNVIDDDIISILSDSTPQ